MLLNGGSAVERQSQRLLKALKMLDVVRSVFHERMGCVHGDGVSKRYAAPPQRAISPLKTGKPFPHLAG